MTDQSVEEFRIEVLERRIELTATKSDLLRVEEKILAEIKSFKQLLKYAGIALLFIMSGTGIISSDVLANLIGLGL